MSIKGLPKRLFNDCYQGQTILYSKVTSLLLYSFLIYTYQMDLCSNVNHVIFYRIRGQTCQLLFPITINWGYTKFKCPSSTSVNDNTKMEFPSSVSTWNVWPQFLYMINLQYTNKISNPTQLEMSHRCSVYAGGTSALHFIMYQEKPN